MLHTLDDTRVSFNGQQLQVLFNDLFHVVEDNRDSDFGLIAVSVDSEQPIPFAASKTLNTSRVMYREQDLISSIQSESLSFTLTLAPVMIHEGSYTPISWNNEMWDRVFRLFDVNDYKPLIFGGADDRPIKRGGRDILETEQGYGTVSRPFFNCMPYAGSMSEIKFFEDSSGYITIPFVCDAPHMWIKVVRNYKRFDGDGSAYGWSLPNYSNVIDKNDSCNVYPVIELYDIQRPKGTEEFLYFSAIPKTLHEYQKKQQAESPEEGVDPTWFNLFQAPLKYSDGSLIERLKVVIDCYNQQVYCLQLPTDADYLPKLLNINYMKYIKPLDFLYAMEDPNHLSPADTNEESFKENGAVYHRQYSDYNTTTSFYRVRFTYACPYMGGNPDDVAIADDYNPIGRDLSTVMPHEDGEEIEL